jgi:predicted amidohydrolase YtcJ
MLADLVVLDKDPLTLRPEQLHTVGVLKTVINGDVVFEASAERP